MVEITDYIPDFAERKSRAIRGSGPNWAIFQRWESELKALNNFPNGRKDFEVARDNDGPAIYSYSKWDESKPDDKDNRRRVYFDSWPDMVKARTFCSLVNEGNVNSALRVYSDIIYSRISEQVDKEHQQHIEELEKQEENF